MGNKRAHYIEMAGIPVCMAFCHSKKIYKREINKLEVKDAPDFVGSDSDGFLLTVHATNGVTLLLCIDSKREMTATELSGIIAHEATHALQRIVIRMGEEIPGKEFEAYTVGYITEQAMIYFLKHQKIKKP